MDDDGLEVIDLSPEYEDDAAAPRRTRRLSRRQVAIIVVGVGVVAVAGGLLAHDRAPHKAAAAPTPSSSVPPESLPATTWVPPAGLTGLAPGRCIAVVLGTPMLVGDGPVRRLLVDISEDALVAMAQRGSALLHFQHTIRIIVGPTFGTTRNALPAAISLLPDADGRWWSNLGQLEHPTALHDLLYPTGTIPVAKLRSGYLVVDNAHTGLFEWRSGRALTRIGVGDARVLAVAGDLVAWSDDVRPGVRVTNLTTRRTINATGVSDPVTARFSPDRTRLAILSGGLAESMVLVDTSSGSLVTSVSTASGGNALSTYRDVPAAFQPVPFSWDGTGRMVLIAQTTLGYFVRTIDTASGSVLRSVAAPEGLQQLIPLAQR